MESWLELPFFTSSDFEAMKQKIIEERKKYTILPDQPGILNAFVYTLWTEVKVVILGQDPYPNKKDAMGLAFSVHPETKPLPKSLQNIYKELENDLGVKRSNGDLSDWATQGVLLLNTCLTVREGQPASHANLGWEKLTNQVIEALSKEKDNLVFILWGNHAIQKSKFIDQTKHLVLTSVHPSPLSAHRGFFGSAPFSATNAYLESHNKPIINW